MQFVTQEKTSRRSFIINFSPREQTILANAARISPQVRGPTIGPNAIDLDSLTDTLGQLAISPTVEEPPEDVGRPKKPPNLKQYIEDISHARTVKKFEKERKDAVQKEVQERMTRTRIKQSDVEAIYENAQINLQRKLATQTEEIEQKVQEALVEHERNNRIEDEELREAAAASQKRVESQKLKLKQMQEKQKITTCIVALKEGQVKFSEHYNKFARTLMSIDQAQRANYTAFHAKGTSLITMYEQTIKSISAGNITDDAVKIIEGLVDEVQKLQEELIARMADDAKEVQAQQQAQQQAPVAAKPLVDQPDARQNVQGLSQCNSSYNQEKYTLLKNLLDCYDRDTEPLLNDGALRQFRLNCTKVINANVNRISGHNASHLMDKYNNLVSILSGNPTMCGDEQINVAAHPLGIKFCTVLLVRKIIDQANTLAGNAVFPFAAVIVAVWQRFPEFGNIFLAQVYRACPYLVPYFVPQREGQSMEDYSRELGYKIAADGTRETEETYLKRIGSIARLYAAVIITKSRKGETQMNPHDLKNAWRWLTNILNMPPLPYICSTILLEVLQIVGYDMVRTYGKQFQKVMVLIQKQYLPRLQTVEEGGPLVRLEELLARGRFEEHTAEVLVQDWW
uniref:mRNA export factor GLE1 n=1 Tax=Nyssomyia neivai TaxID=330878 RepID=A0A1L8DGM7_9DIPT